MRRRDLIVMLGGGAIAWPRAAGAADTAPAIGMLSPFPRAEIEPWHRAFRQGMRDLGWNEGDNVRYVYRYADGDQDRLPRLIAELLDEKVAVILTAVTTDAIPAAHATKTVPIVIAAAGDPLRTGLVASLARPGGNVTGLTQIATDLAGKRLALLKEIAPQRTRVAVLWNPKGEVSTLAWQDSQEPARRLGLTLHSLEVDAVERLDAAFAAMTAAGDHALTVMPHPVFVDAAKRIADFAVAQGMSSIFHLPDFVNAGGLLSYGPDRPDLFRRAAAYVDKILKGAHPADLPVERPVKFQLIVNLKTAKALGIIVPQTLLATADAVIE